MKSIVRILILAEFAAIVFIPSAYLPRWALIPMFVSMAGLVVLSCPVLLPPEVSGGHVREPA